MSAADDIWNDLFGGFESLNRRIEDMFSQMDMTDRSRREDVRVHYVPGT